MAERAFISWRGVERGARDMAFVGVYAFLFGIAFGVAARNVGLDGWAAVLMSGLVFAGGSQFAALELWGSPVAWGPILVATLAINGRHVLLAASLYPWLRGLPPWQRHATVALLSDPNWASAVRDHDRGGRDAGVIVGSGLVLWVAWVAGTVIGAWLVELSETAFRRFGLDLVFLTFLASVLAGLRRGRADDLAWLAAALAALAAVAFLPTNWHVLAGGVLGGLVGLVVHERR